MTEPLLGDLLLGAIALHRGLELVWARANLRRLVARGGVVVRDDGFAGLLVVHGAWLLCMLLERRLLGARMIDGVSIPCLAAFAAVEALRAWTLATLGRRWTVRVVVLPGELPVRRGPYRFLRHPNYVVIVLEMIFAPLALGAWRTAALLLLPNVVTVLRRIRREEAAWRETAGLSLP